MAERVNPLIGSTSCGLVLRIIQFVLGGLVIGLAAYTVSVNTGWREARFTVAAVYPSTIEPKILIERVPGSLSPSYGWCQAA